MCGRYAQGKAIPNLIEHYARHGRQIIADEQGLMPFERATPGTYAPVLIEDAGQLRLVPMRWGLVPHWAQSPETQKQKPFNARSETVATTPFFRDAYKSARCLVPATGFYEWQGERAPKQPWFIQLQHGGLFSFAGLWARWRGQQGEALNTFTILTTTPNTLMQPIHDRMPCILAPEYEMTWLTPPSPAALKPLLHPYPAESMSAQPLTPDAPKPPPRPNQLDFGW